MSISTPRGLDDDRLALVRLNLRQDLAPSSPVTKSFPTISQALVMKHMLMSTGLPLELVDSIMDFAEYWPSITTRMKDTVAVLNEPGIKITEFYSIMFTYHHWVAEYVKTKELLRTYFSAPSIKAKTGRSWRSKVNHRASDSRAATCVSPATTLPVRGRRPCHKVIFDIISREDCSISIPDEPRTWFEATLRKPKDEDSGAPDVPMVDLAQQFSEISINPPSTRRRSSVITSMQNLWPNPMSAARGRSTKKKAAQSLSPSEMSPTFVAHNDPDTRLNKNHKITWRYDDFDPNEDSGRLSEGANFVRAIEVGDNIILFARTSNRDGNNPPCMSYVASASVTIYWAV